MKPELVQLAAQREEHREPDERRQDVALAARCRSSVSTPGREQDAQAEKRDRRRVERQASRPMPQSATMPTNADQHDPSRRGVSGPSAASACRAAAGASGVARQLRARSAGRAASGMQRHARSSVGTRRGEQPRTESDLDAERSARSPRPAGWRPSPSARAPTRALRLDDAGEHQERADAPAAVVVGPSRPPLRRARTPAG